MAFFKKCTLFDAYKKTSSFLNVIKLRGWKQTGCGFILSHYDRIKSNLKKMHDKKKIFQAIYKLLSYNYIVLRKAVVETY